MGLSRRQFAEGIQAWSPCSGWSKGFSINEAARTLEVNSNVLHRWCRRRNHFLALLAISRNPATTPLTNRPESSISEYLHASVATFRGRSPETGPLVKPFGKHRTRSAT